MAETGTTPGMPASEAKQARMGGLDADGRKDTAGLGELAGTIDVDTEPGLMGRLSRVERAVEAQDRANEMDEPAWEQKRGKIVPKKNEEITQW